MFTKVFPKSNLDDNAEKPLSISLHHTGLIIAIGFKNLFKIYHILSENIRKYKQKHIPGLHVNVIKFNHAGNIIALACDKQIKLYNL
jgi:hypothetical protein